MLSHAFCGLSTIYSDIMQKTIEYSDNFADFCKKLAIATKIENY